MNSYEAIDFLNKDKNILLVRDTRSGAVFVKKFITAEQRKIYEILRKSNYTGVPRVVDLLSEHGCDVLIEEYFDGVSLQYMLDNHETFSRDFVRRTAVFLCNTLKPMHRNRLIHRDISASNVLYSNGVFRLIDFGNARVFKPEKSSDTQFLGTRDYAAPEQMGYAQSDRRTDIFAIGALMNILLCGEAYNKQLTDDTRFRKVIKRCVSVKPDDRYKNVSKLRSAVNNAFSPLRKVFVSLGCAAVVAAGIALIVSLSSGSPSQNNNAYDPDSIIKAVATLTPMEIAGKRWTDIENNIAAGKYDTAQAALDAAASEGITGFNLYLLYSQNYEAQGLYDKAAEIVFYYFDNINTEKVTKDNLMYHRLAYLYPHLSAELKSRFDALSVGLQ